MVCIPLLKQLVGVLLWGMRVHVVYLHAWRSAIHPCPHVGSLYLVTAGGM